MAGRRVQYQIVGRYMDGTSVTGYQMQSIETGKSGKFTREQAAFLVGRGQVTNCDASIYQDKVIFKGIGVSLESLPIIRDGKVSNTDRIGHVRRDVTPEQAVNQLMISGVIVSGRNTVGYVIRNAGGQEKKIKREDCLKLASQNRLGNARIQNYNGKVILRGVGVNLNELPVTKIDQNNQNPQDTQSQANTTSMKPDAKSISASKPANGKRNYICYAYQEEVSNYIDDADHEYLSSNVEGMPELVSSIKSELAKFHINMNKHAYFVFSDRDDDSTQCVELSMRLESYEKSTVHLNGVKLEIFLKDNRVSSAYATKLDDFQESNGNKTPGELQVLKPFNNRYFYADASRKYAGIDYSDIGKAAKILQKTIAKYVYTEIKEKDIKRVINIGKENQAGANAGAGQSNASAGQAGAGQRARKKVVYYGAQENVNIDLKKLKKRGPGIPIKGIDTLLKGIAERVNSFQDLKVAGYTYNAFVENGQSRHDQIVDIPFLIKQDSGDTTKVMGVEITIFTKNKEINSVLSTYISDKAHSQKTAGYDSTLKKFNDQYFDRLLDEAGPSKGLDYQNMEYAIQIIQNTIVTYALAELRQNDIQKPENVFDVEKYIREERARK